MAFIVETGAGTPGANALASIAFVTAYLTDRGRETQNGWSTSTTGQQQAAIVLATDYIETVWGPLLRGEKALTEIEGREASGLLSLTVIPVTGSTFTLGQRTYRMVDALALENDVLIGSDVDETIANIVAAVTLADGALDDVVEEHTQPHYQASAVDQSPDVAFYALEKGESGNLIALSTNIVGATVTAGGFLKDGIDAAEQPLSFPRVDLYTAAGTLVVGVPLKAKQACAEYAVRARAATLRPDPTVDERYRPILRERSKVGPIEEEFQYGTAPTDLLKPYPAADALLAEYLEPAGQASVIRG